MRGSECSGWFCFCFFFEKSIIHFDSFILNHVPPTFPTHKIAFAVCSQCTDPLLTAPRPCRWCSQSIDVGACIDSSTDAACPAQFPTQIASKLECPVEMTVSTVMKLEKTLISIGFNFFFSKNQTFETDSTVTVISTEQQTVQPPEIIDFKTVVDPTQPIPLRNGEFVKIEVESGGILTKTSDGSLGVTNSDDNLIGAGDSVRFLFSRAKPAVLVELQLSAFEAGERVLLQFDDVLARERRRMVQENSVTIEQATTGLETGLYCLFIFLLFNFIRLK